MHVPFLLFQSVLIYLIIAINLCQGRHVKMLLTVTLRSHFNINTRFIGIKIEHFSRLEIVRTVICRCSIQLFSQSFQGDAVWF